MIIETDGFGVFNDRQKQSLIRRLAETRGILILTDSDSAGFRIRGFIGGFVPPETVTHAYIPDIFGKERRKLLRSKEGKLGVEGVELSVILDALRKAGVIYEETREPSRKITKNDLYEDGFTGREDSKSRKKRLLARLDLPERLSTSSMLTLLNVFLTYDEYKAATAEVLAEENADAVQE